MHQRSLAWVFVALLTSDRFNAARAETTPPPSSSAAAPVVDPASVTYFADEGRLELKGRHLDGVRVRAPGGDQDICLKPLASGAGEQCAFAVPRALPVDASFFWLPPARPSGEGGAEPAPTPLRPARVVLDRVLPAATSVDLTSGAGRIPLLHPEAVAAVDCTQGHCELSESAIQVFAIAGAATSIGVRLRLAPHVFVRRGEALETTVTSTVGVLHCSLAIASGAPLRNAELTRVVVRMDDRCGRAAPDLRWTINGQAAQPERIEKEKDAVYVLLGAGRIEDPQATVTATRPEPDGSVVAVARTPTRAAPQPRAAIELPTIGRIDFIPTNRDALLRVGSAGDHAHLVPLPIESVYRVVAGPQGTTVRGEAGSGGWVSLRYGYRVDGLPAALASTDLAVLEETVQHPLREASVPAPLGTSTLGPTPLLELVCVGRDGRTERILPGKQTSIPFAQRDSCRLVIHRERLTAEQGTQDVAVDVSVTKVDDSPRAEAHATTRMVLRPGAEPRVFWIHGAEAPYDRLAIRVSHIVDEAHDVGGSDLHVDLPTAQWAVVTGEGRLRFYATAAIPTGLYRITAPSDVLTLNFGALSRLTWLDADGHEGLFGLELGAMGIGLAATPGFPRALAALGGVGVGVPIGNRGEPSQASVNLHAWIAYELRGETPKDPKNPTGPSASHWSFLFGPSITFGNVGTNL